MTQRKFDFGYITLFVGDLERNKAFYEAIGLLLTEHRDDPKACRAQLASDVYLTLVECGESQQPTACELSFGVVSYSGAKQRLREAGFEPSPDHHPANPRGSFTFFDPDGRKIELDEFG